MSKITITSYGREALDAWKAEFAASLELQSAHKDALAFVSHQTIYGAPPAGFTIDANGTVRRIISGDSLAATNDGAGPVVDHGDEAAWTVDWQNRADLQVMFVAAEHYVAHKRDEARTAAFKVPPAKGLSVRMADYRREFEGSADLQAEFLSVEHYLALRRHDARRAGQEVVPEAGPDASAEAKAYANSTELQRQFPSSLAYEAHQRHSARQAVN